MKVFIAGDHAGFELKEKVKAFLQEKGYSVEDCGAFVVDSNDDYPDFIGKAAQGVANNPDSRGVIIGGSGQGEAIAANKVTGVRAIVFYSACHPVSVADVTGRESDDPYEIIRLGREHNDANVLSLAARFLTPEEATKAVQLFLETPFPTDPRHVRRIAKIQAIEKDFGNR